MDNKPEVQAQGNLVAGKVIKVGAFKTVTVEVVHAHRHPLYKKEIKRRKRFAVHNESLELTVGDKVNIRETKPISKNKHFIVVEKI